MTADAVHVGSVVGQTEDDLAQKLEELNRCLSANAKAVTSCLSVNKLNRNPSKTSLTSNLSDVCTESENASNLSGFSENKTNKWPSFSNAFPSFITTSSNAPFLSTISHCQQWNNVIKSWEQYSKKRTFTADLIRTGIPDQFRPVIWQLFTGAHDSPLKQIYHNYLIDVSPFERAITRDVSRTYPKHEFFKDRESAGQQRLFNVMKAYSLYDREVGYCQGSAFIVGLLLMQMTEEEAFVVLVQLMNEYRLRELYKPCMTELGVCMHQLDGMIAEHLPELHAHFVTQAFAPSHYASAWFLTLFATAFPIPMATRVMDLFIAEGMEFIFRLSLAILKQFAPRLLTMDMETMIFSLQQTDLTEWEDHGRTLFETAMTLKLNSRRMKRLRNEYLVARSQEQAEQIEVRRLRTENGLLLQRLARLEEDNDYLAKQLVDCNVERAELSEEVVRLRGCLSRYQASLLTPIASSSLLQASTALGEPLIDAVVLTEDENAKSLDFSSSPPFDGDTGPLSTPPLLMPSSPVHQSRRQQGVTMPTISNGNQTEIPSPRSSDRGFDDSGAAKTLTPTTSGAESWASIYVSPTSMSRNSNDHLLIDTIHQLETDLAHIRVRESEHHSALRESKERIRILEERLESARKEPEVRIEVLHSELMKVKLREAEGLLKQEEFRERVEEIQALWQNHLALTGGGGGKLDVNGGARSSGLLRVGADLIQSKLRRKAAPTSATDNGLRLSDRLLEMKLYCQIANLQQKVKDLMSQNETAERRATRMEEQKNDLVEKLERSVLRETALRTEIKESECRCAALEAKCKSDALLWRIREIEFSSYIAELRQHYSGLDCLHDVEYASSTLQGHHVSGLLSVCSSAAPTPKTQRSSNAEVRKAKGSAGSNTVEGRIAAIWKDLPLAIMTESIGPLEDLCILPDDPLITSIYMQENGAKELTPPRPPPTRNTPSLPTITSLV